MSNFRMHCPKCESSDVEGLQDRFNSAFRRAVLMLHCRTCGKILYGEEAIEKVYLVQKKRWEATQKQAEATQRTRDHEMALVERHQRQQTARRMRKEQQDILDMERVVAKIPAPAKKLQPAPSEVVEVPHPADDGACAWHECSKPSRENSKYCSRNCSNKNARWRYAQRQAQEASSA